MNEQAAPQWLHPETHDVVVTDKAIYTLLYDPMKGRWIAWVTSPDSERQIDNSDFEREHEARARIQDIYWSLEKVPLQ